MWSGLQRAQCGNEQHQLRNGADRNRRHHAFQQDVAVVGGGNSAAEAALELWRNGARVTLVHFGPTFDKKIKPWILPDLTNRIAEGSIQVRWNARVRSIEAGSLHLQLTDGRTDTIPADHVYLLTGYSPNVELLRAAGVPIDASTGIPAHHPATLETSVPGLFVAGVVLPCTLAPGAKVTPVLPGVSSVAVWPTRFMRAKLGIATSGLPLAHVPFNTITPPSRSPRHSGVSGSALSG